MACAVLRCFALRCAKTDPPALLAHSFAVAHFCSVSSYQNQALIERVKDSMNLTEIASDVKDAAARKPVLTRKQELALHWVQSSDVGGWR